MKKISKLYEEFSKLIQTRQERRGEKWEQEQAAFCSMVESTCFNIVTVDIERIKALEKLNGVVWYESQQELNILGDVFNTLRKRLDKC